MMPDTKEYLDDGSAAITGDGQSDVLDLGSGVGNLGDGTDIKWVTILDTPFAQDTGTVDIVLQHSPDNSTWADLIELPQLNLGAGTNPDAGTIARVGLPAEHDRYLRINYVTSGTVDAGVIKSFLHRG